jgi:hypothetical protein
LAALVGGRTIEHSRDGRGRRSGSCKRRAERREEAEDLLRSGARLLLLALLVAGIHHRPCPATMQVGRAVALLSHPASRPGWTNRVISREKVRSVLPFFFPSPAGCRDTVETKWSLPTGGTLQKIRGRKITRARGRKKKAGVLCSSYLNIQQHSRSIWALRFSTPPRRVSWSSHRGRGTTNRQSVYSRFFYHPSWNVGSHFLSSPPKRHSFLLDPTPGCAV